MKANGVTHILTFNTADFTRYTSEGIVAVDPASVCKHSACYYRVIKRYNCMIESNINSTSVFDLSPPEELQLVEDLRDDLPATPEAVTVYQWQ